MGRLPLFSIVQLPAADGRLTFASASIASVQKQLYPYWELWLTAIPTGIDVGSDARFRMLSMPAERDFGTRFNAALAQVEGDFVLPLPGNARLAESALYEVAVAISEASEVDLLYTDEDQVNATGERRKPHFKTGWDPDLALGRDAIGLLVAYRKELLRQVNGMTPRINSIMMTLYDLSLRVAFAIPPHHICHIPAVLCHRTADGGGAACWDADVARQIVRAQLRESNERTSVVPAPLAPCWNRVIRELPDPQPPVSIIVPTRDHAELLERCAASVLSGTNYCSIELIIVDNDSQEPAALQLLNRLSQHSCVRILQYRHPFNYAAQNNLAAHEAKGDVLVLLNNDTEALTPDWLREMVSHALRPDVGAVGAKLVYPDQRIQHGGMVLGPGVWPQHQLRFADRAGTGPFGELALTRTVSIVTGACLALRKAVFFEVGGLDEQLKASFNDIDLCMRIGDCGYRIIWSPFAELLHVESVSRGPDDTLEKRAMTECEIQHFWRSWRSLRNSDPFHNPNLVYGWDSLNLSWPPRRKPPWRG
jgi:GT2 family glycosyltransferase